MNILDIIDWGCRGVTAIALIWGFVLWAKGIIPVLYRLGNGLARRKIAIFAEVKNLESMKNLLEDTNLFDQKNIFGITKRDEIERAESKHASLYLVYWEDWDKKDIDAILHIKKDECALIIYAPPRSIPPTQMKELELKRNISVTNFRGRLLNDIVTAMITTSYQK